MRVSSEISKMGGGGIPCAFRDHKCETAALCECLQRSNSAPSLCDKKSNPVIEARDELSFYVWIKEVPVLENRVDNRIVNVGPGALETSSVFRWRFGFSLVFCVLVLVSILGLRADNGLAAFASPLESLQVDGDLSDWPSSIDRQSVRSVQHFDYPTGPEDGYVFF
ncbi:MAG: hypothetical protein HOI66_05035 [Verrucomicrobia bacterium]|nr:hypothetical protein [Verrucomicrobiota bacterium]